MHTRCSDEFLPAEGIRLVYPSPRVVSFFFAVKLQVLMPSEHISLHGARGESHAARLRDTSSYVDVVGETL